ncbi:unnamed protein product [Phaedon cochleariae]|uniref:Myb/SANT-like DNA-binding domain-containing protein n=1 Tax=Phaedon cochleariae TaxID=80249 RepID=A0A9N9X5X3_PHACE|nr:unnamed protein product [Phaedon cochleariae]
MLPLRKEQQSYDEELAEDDASTSGVPSYASNNETSENQEDEGDEPLLETYRRLEKKFLSGKHSHKKSWEEISQILEKEGYTATGPQCASKLRSLKITYKSIKDHNNKSGNDKRTWPFYEIMDEIFSKKAWCAPVAVASSSGISTKSASESEYTSLKESPKTPVAKLLAKRLGQKEDQEEARNKRHREKMEMDQKFLDILEKLVEKK